MVHFSIVELLTGALLVSPSLGAYVLKKNYQGQNFTSAFNFRTV